jgi:hypothetical protein
MFAVVTCITANYLTAAGGLLDDPEFEICTLEKAPHGGEDSREEELGLENIGDEEDADVCVRLLILLVLIRLEAPEEIEFLLIDEAILDDALENIYIMYRMK